MKSKRFSVEQIVSAIKQHEAGLSIAEIPRKNEGSGRHILCVEKEVFRAQI